MHSMKPAELKKVVKSSFRFRHPGQQTVQLALEPGYSADVRFFLDQAVSMAVACVARNQCQRARLVVAGRCSVALNILISTIEECGTTRFLAYTNDSSFFGGGSVHSLYVMNQSSRDIEHAIFLFLLERLAEEDVVTAYIYREKTDGMFDPPVLFGTSDEGPGSIKERLGNVGI